MLNNSLRCRIEALNRAPLAERTDVVVSERRPASQPAVVVAKNKTQRFSHCGLLRRGEIIKTPAGEHWRTRLPLEMLWHGGTKLAAARQDYLRSQFAAARQAIEPTIVLDAEFAPFIAALPDRTLVLDLETCGLAGAALFLVGLLRQIDGSPTVELLLARNFAEEAAVLESLWRTVTGHDVLVTFNGKSFDWPMVLDRSVRHRLQPPADCPRLHLDMLHHARRRWRNRLPDCRLQTLERHVCRRNRAADIPGHAIPAVYADYVRTGFERDMDTVLYHNALDLVTLFDLALRLAA